MEGLTKMYVTNYCWRVQRDWSQVHD